MNCHIGMALVALLGWVRVSAEEPIPAVKLFALPKVELKQPATNDAAKIERPAGELKAAQEKSDSQEEFSLTAERSSGLSEASVQSFETMNGGAVLSQLPRPVEIGGAAGWVQEKVWDPVFAPEVVKLGKVKVTGGVVAALKRKNPFCLLHPLVFAASW